MKTRVDLRLYDKDAVLAVLYEYSGQYNVSQSIDNDENFIVVTLLPKQDSELVPDDSLLGEFEQKLIDQQLRIHINKEFGHIRDLIVEEAFKPISK